MNTNESEVSYIDLHIRDELKYLLCGAKVWKLLEDKSTALGEDRIHLQAHIMTSCFVRIRNLYLYFTLPKSVSIRNSYNINFPKSQLFAKDKRTIEAKVMHLSPAKERESEKSINGKILLYTEDILRIIADHLDNLKDINPEIYKALLNVTKDCYIEANNMVNETRVFQSGVYENRIAKHLS